MNVIAYSQLNIFALIFLFIIYGNVHHSGEKRLYDQKLFLIILILNAALLVLDTAQWLLSGVAGQAMRVLSLLVAAVYCAMTPAPCYIWSLYADFQVNRDEKRIRKLAALGAIPLSVNCILALMSVQFGLIFRIDESNVYHRGELFYLLVIICYSYLFYSLFYVFTRRKSIDRRVFLPLMLFAIPPFIGGIVQSLFFGVSIVWACMGLSVLIIFINLQNNQLMIDYLTGLNNRRQLDRQMQEWFNSSAAEEELGGIMVDIDSFKQINDIYGHATGDMALIEAGKILQASFRKDDLISRYGGDEFVVILRIQDRSDLISAVDRLKANIERFRAQKNVPYCIDFSIGYDSYRRDSGITIQQFLKHIDHLMYQDKCNKKNG